MTHSFDTGIAEKLGVNCAIILQNLTFWCSKNKANNNNFFDDNWWTYNSIKAWKELFPYIGETAIRNALQKLEDANYIKSGNHNANAYDRTRWFCIIHLAKTTNGFAENSETIPDSKPDNKPDNKHIPFSFSLKRKYAYDNLSDEYKEKLYGACMLIDGKESRYEDFIISLRSNGYKYKNFPMAYMNWDKERAYKNFTTEPEEKLGDGWRRVVLGDGKLLAVNEDTFEVKRGRSV